MKPATWDHAAPRSHASQKCWSAAHCWTDGCRCCRSAAARPARRTAQRSTACAVVEAAAEARDPSRRVWRPPLHIEKMAAAVIGCTFWMVMRVMPVSCAVARWLAPSSRQGTNSQREWTWSRSTLTRSGMLPNGCAPGAGRRRWPALPGYTRPLLERSVTPPGADLSSSFGRFGPGAAIPGLRYRSPARPGPPENVYMACGNGSALRPSPRQDSVCRVLPSRQAFHALMAIATSASRPDSVEY
jgi:hypothetical protein